MNFHAVHLPRGSVLSRNIVDDESFTLVYGEGGGSTLNISGGAEAIYLPLRGSLHVTTSSHVNPVHAGETLVAEYDTLIKVLGYANAQWMAMVGGKRAWKQILGKVKTGLFAGAQLLPARHVTSRNLRRHAIALARMTATPLLESTIHAVIDGIATLQAPLHDAISRCPGRTHAKRRQVFLRLQRVRNFISSCCDQNLDNSVLARMASYSPCHFLRIFHQVFQETPHTHLVNERLRLARRLLHTSDLAIMEVALASGFENRSAFSRLFHQRFGITANEARRRTVVGVCGSMHGQRGRAICATY